MKSDPTSQDHQLLDLLQAVRDTHDESARKSLNEFLRNNQAARAAMARLMVDEQALITRLRDDSIVSLLDSASAAPPEKVSRFPRWSMRRPITAAAAGLVMGMFGASLAYAFVSNRTAGVKKVPLVVDSPGWETSGTILGDGLPRQAGVWGSDSGSASARVVIDDQGVQPLEGRHMLRVDPLPPEKEMKNHLSRIYYVIDLQTQPLKDVADDAEVQVTAAFAASRGDAASRFLIRAFALNETPEQATKGFWPKTDEDGVVSAKRTFEILPGDRAWHTFSLKMSLPRGAKTLVIMLGSGRLEGDVAGAQSHYIDDVRVSVLNPEPALP